MNKIHLIGRLTKDHDIKDFNGNKLLNNTIAVQRDFKNKDGEYDADFINISLGGENRVNVFQQYLQKGSKLAISGSLRINNSKKEDGTYNNFVNVNVDSFEFLDSKNDNQNQQPAQPTNQSIGNNSSNGANDFDSGFNLDDDVPF